MLNCCDRIYINLERITFVDILIFLSVTVISLITLWRMGGIFSNKMSANAIKPVVISATSKHTASVIFLHGLGDTGHGWSEAFSAIKRPHIRYVCPTAHVIPVTLNGGMRMPSWFDIKGLGVDSEQDEAGIKSSSELLQGLINEEEKLGIPRNRILIGGFSQGGAVALYSALTVSKSNVAGVVALSTWLPLNKSFPQAVVANQATPILQCHGTEDQLLDLRMGQLCARIMQTINKSYEFKTYPNMGHSSCDEEMSDVKKFIDKCLPLV